jgi:hypothetical protein
VPSKEATAARFEDGRMLPLLDSRVGGLRRRRKECTASRMLSLLDSRVGDPLVGFEGGDPRRRRKERAAAGSAEGGGLRM